MPRLPLYQPPLLPAYSATQRARLTLIPCRRLPRANYSAFTQRASGRSVVDWFLTPYLLQHGNALYIASPTPALPCLTPYITCPYICRRRSVTFGCWDRAPIPLPDVTGRYVGCGYSLVGCSFAPYMPNSCLLSNAAILAPPFICQPATQTFC